MNKLRSLALAGFAAAIFAWPGIAQNNPPAQPAEDPDVPPAVEPDPNQPAPPPLPAPATNSVVPTPRIPPPTTLPSLPRQFPRPLGGATNYPTRPGALPTVRPAGPGTPNTAVNAPGTTAATPGVAAPTVVTNTILGPAGDATDIINFKNMPLDQFLDEYATIARRTVLRAANLPLQSQVNFKPASPLTPEERLQMYDTILALNGITMIPTGEKAVLAVPSAQAMQEGAAFANRKVEDYAEASQFVTHVIKVEHVNVQEAAETLKQFAKNPNGILALETTKTLVLRDYAINVKRMLEVLAKIDVEVEQEYQFEVIPIKFGKVEELYQTLNSVISGGGGGGGTGLATGSARQGLGAGSRLGGGLGGLGGGSRLGGSGSSYGGRSSYGQGYYGQSHGIEEVAEGMEPLMPQQATVPRPTTTTTPGATGSFQQRFSNLNRGGQGQNPAQPLSSEASITPDPRSNSLIIYANKKDMAQLKKIIGRVDTLLAQVLIETVIMEVGLTSGLSYGVSAIQKYTQFNPNLGGGGAMDNLNYGGFTNLVPTIPTGGGLNYLLRFNDNINVVVKALASDANVNVLQRPRIITSHAVEASFFAGSTVPFIQGTYYGGGTQVGTSSYYDRQDVGVELSVIPYITPDGLVFMEVSQRIEEIAPPAEQALVQSSPNAPVTNKRSATSTISVHTGESVLLGGFIRALKTKSNAGVPILKDIPLLGNLFRSTTVDKARTELMILMQPTVLKTPEAAANLTKQYQQESPQIRMMEQDFREERERLNKAARKGLVDPLNSDEGIESVFPMDPTKK
ncbi:MAG TPA: secretin N-terminal domain-containing protein [Verrucomicrobiota bacterium]|nr:hypothetical protein [Verrucomicrobiales bacterium]HRI12938.1 secretin N-terminal domain-containing protein [Verrucomicrobiota bacterium]